MLLFNFCHSLLSSYRTEVLWTPGTHRGTQPPPHRSGPFNAGFFDISSKANSMSSIGICIWILICSHTTFLQHCSSAIKMKKVIRKEIWLKSPNFVCILFIEINGRTLFGSRQVVSVFPRVLQFSGGRLAAHPGRRQSSSPVELPRRRCTHLIGAHFTRPTRTTTTSKQTE